MFFGIVLVEGICVLRSPVHHDHSGQLILLCSCLPNKLTRNMKRQRLSLPRYSPQTVESVKAGFSQKAVRAEPAFDRTWPPFSPGAPRASAREIANSSG